MPVKRIRTKLRRLQITEADAEVFITSRNDMTLRRALGLKPWEFGISVTLQSCRTAEEIMRHKEKIAAELSGHTVY